VVLRLHLHHVLGIEYRDKMKTKEVLAGDLKLGEYAVFKRPAKFENEPYYERSNWYGSKNAYEYNDEFVDGVVIKINPKNIKIKQILFPESWDYGHEYIIPKDARVISHTSLNKARAIKLRSLAMV